jgi:hypothetical protein
MRILVAILLLSAVPFGRAWANDSDYHRVQFGATSTTGNMDYWDDNQNAHQMLMGGTSADSGSGSLGAALNTNSQHYCNATLNAACQASPYSSNIVEPYPLGINANNAFSQPQVPH